METIIDTELGCPYGKQLQNTLTDKRSLIADLYVEAVRATLDFASSRERMSRVLDEESKSELIENTLLLCNKCHGKPEEASSNDSVCPIAKLAVRKLFE